MASNTNKNIIYTKCSQIPMGKFDIIRREDDYRFMVVGFDGYNDVKVPDNAGEIFYDILNEYCELDGNREALDFYELRVEISRLELRQEIVNALLETLCYLDDNGDQAIVAELHQWGMNIDLKKDFDSELERMFRTQRGWLTKINRKKEALKEFDSDEEPVTLLEQKVNLERILDKNHIDLMVVSAEEWVYLKKSGIKIINIRQKWQAQT